MGPYKTFRTSFGFIAVSFAALVMLGATGLTAEKAEARMPAAQTHPIISLNQILARDANTFQNDKALEAGCRKTGHDKSICLCVTHVMKYELTLDQYRAATRLYGQNGNHEDLRRTLQREGFQLEDIYIAEGMERTLISDPNFASRCATAKAYYRTKVK